MLDFCVEARHLREQVLQRFLILVSALSQGQLSMIRHWLSIETVANNEY